LIRLISADGHRAASKQSMIQAGEDSHSLRKPFRRLTSDAQTRVRKPALLNCIRDNVVTGVPPLGQKIV
jgi:hypothetical protein